MRYFYTQTLLAKARVTTHNARARMLVVYPPHGACAREAGADAGMGPGAEGEDPPPRGSGCGSLAVTECLAVTERELCTVHKWGANWPLLNAGVIGGYGGVTAGLRRG